ncbi:hypothetical protein niasHS_003302 [Heterodera schachtii]|uniref:Uncharacterized protein n=1 Tax=Heterodera schachtii TaxID=97005 RepID=A0ABD2KG98_HETSC
MESAQQASEISKTNIGKVDTENEEDKKELASERGLYSDISENDGSCTGVSRRRPIPRCKTIKDLKQDVVIEYAGFAADLKLIGDATSGSGKDITKATDIIMSITRSLAMAGGPGRPWLNYEIATPSASDLEWFRAREQEISIECQTEAEKQVDKHWDCISALATALDESPMWEMNEDELTKFFDEWDAKSARLAAPPPVTELTPGISNAPPIVAQEEPIGQNEPPSKKAKNDTGVDEDGEKYC